MKSKWVLFQTHTITLSNGYILQPESHFLTDAIKFAKYEEKHRIHIFFFYFKFKMDFMVNHAIKEFLKCFESCNSSEEAPHCLPSGQKYGVSYGC